jgi:hypothetical protein
MKFCVTWNIPQDKLAPVLKTFASMTPKQRTDVGQGVRLVGRWHNVTARTGVAIFETDDMMALQRYATLWNPHMDLSIEPMLEDEELVEVYRHITG